MTSPDIKHDVEKRRFAAEVDGGTAELAYTDRGGVLDLMHTLVPSQSREQGVGSALVEHAVAYARQKGQKIIPSCPFVRAWLAEHPEAEDVVESGRR